MKNRVIYPNPSIKSLGKDKITESKLEDFIFGGKMGFFAEEPVVPEKRAVEPAWVDEDDFEQTIVFDNKNKYHCSNTEETITIEDYKERLRKDFLKVHGDNHWAKISLRDQDGPENELLRNSDFRENSERLKEFRPNELAFHKCPDLSKKHLPNGSVTSLHFHERARLFLVGSVDKSLRFFGYGADDTTNLVSKVCTEKFPIKCARFVGNDFVVATARSSTFLCYDLRAEKAVFVPPARGLHGTLRSFSESPNDEFLAFHSSTRGQIHLMDFKSREFVKTYTKNGAISASHFLRNDKILLNGDDDSVWVWDIRMHRCCHKFVDRGSVRGTTLSVSSDGKYVVCGSSTGIVNMYSTVDCLSSPNPTPIRTFSNLVTSCSHSVFDRSSSVLSILSCHKVNAIKLIHVGSHSVFSNFPFNDMGVCTVVDFSPTTGLMGIGDINGKVRMIRLESFDM